MNTLAHACSFAEVRDEVLARADRMLPDRVVHVADLRMDTAGRLVGPGMPTYRLNGWSRKQLASIVGVRWAKWFAAATPEERAEEVTRRLARTPGELKVRAWKDDTGAADGVARAFLARAFTPIDDARVFDRIAANLGGALEDYRFTGAEFTESTSHVTAVRLEPADLHGDLLHPGWRLRNSEVGAAPLTLDDYVLRQVCSNGLMLQVGGKRALYRTHRAIDDDHLAAALVIALGKLPARWATVFGLLQAARTVEVRHPDAAVLAVLDAPDVPKGLAEEAAKVVLKDNDRTRYGVAQAITFVAHAVNRDPDTRFVMERLAGDYLAAEPPAAA